MHNTDIFFIILFLVVVSVIIGLNIVMVVDKKISSVSINIPPIKVPEANIILNIDGAESRKINISGCSSKKSSKVEPFIVSDAQDTPHYDEIKAEYLSKPNKFNDPKDTTYDPDKPSEVNPLSPTAMNMKNVPGLDEPVSDFSIMVTNNEPVKKYHKGRLERPFITAADYGWDAPPVAVSCSNSSIAKQFKYGKDKLMPTIIGCGYPNKLTAENYYKTWYTPQVIPIEDYHIRGANYGNYSVYPTPYQTSHMKILSQNTKGLNEADMKHKNIPTGSNYAFHNTPAMPMP
jgi:hypothetical protein